MIILSVETSATTCGAALSDDTGLIAEASVFIPNVHDTHLQMVVENCLQQAGITVDNITVCAVNSGPGSFTGLRIGASFVKGLCFDGRIKLLPISSLEASAASAQEIAQFAGNKNILATMGSHRNLGFIQRFSSEMMPLSAVEHCSLQEVTQLAVQEYIVCGTWAPFIQEQNSAVHAISGISRMSARFVARRATQLLRNEPLFADPLLWSPNYFSNNYEQPPQA